MKIGIDCQYLLTNISAGPEKYTINIIRSLLKMDRENHYILYFKEAPSKKFLEFLGVLKHKAEIRVLSQSFSWTQISLMWELRKNPVDVFFTPFHTLPVLNTSFFLRIKKTKWVSMIHGVDYVFEHHSLLKKIWQFFPLWYTVFFSDEVIVPSKHTKKKITQRGWGKGPEEVFVIPEGVSSEFKKYSSEEVREVQQKYDLDGVSFLIFISTIQPRKNVPGLVEGFSVSLKSKEIPSDTKLVIVGKKGWDYQESFQAPLNFGVDKSVVFLGRVPDVDLPKLLSGAKAYVSTSFEEGFGLPLLEAMASEVPFMVSDIPSYQSISKGLGVVIAASDVNSISKGIVQVVNSYPKEDVEKAKEIAKNYSWDKAAQKTLSILTK